MASSRSSPPAEPGGAGPASPAPPASLRRAAPGAPGSDPVTAAVRAGVAPLLPSDAAAGRASRIAVALSGGRDSMVLLDALAGTSGGAFRHRFGGACPPRPLAQRGCLGRVLRRRMREARHRARAPARAGRAGAGRQPRSDRAHGPLFRARDRRRRCRRARPPCRRSGGNAAAAIAARRRAARARRDAGRARGRRPRAHPAAARAAARGPGDYARQHGVAWIDDESNADTGLRRNFLRHEIAPRLAAAFPGYPATLVRAAAHTAEAAHLLDELAALDAGDAAGSGDEAATLDRAALAALAQRSLPRARNVLRWFLRRRGLPPPSTARLAAMLVAVRARRAGCARSRRACRRRARYLSRAHRRPRARRAAPFAIAWSGEPALALPHGVLEFEAARGEGLAANVLETMPVTVRRREGGERLRVAVDRPSRAVRRLLYDAGIEPWQRASLPLVWCGETLAAVPGIGIDAAMRAAADAPGIVLHWHPRQHLTCGSHAALPAKTGAAPPPLRAGPITSNVDPDQVPRGRFTIGSRRSVSGIVESRSAAPGVARRYERRRSFDSSGGCEPNFAQP